MKIAVMGAGAVGSYYGGMLARAGHEVVLIARPGHVQTMADKGLLLETQTFREFIPVQASTQASPVRDADTMLFCVKSTDTESAGVAIRPFLSRHTLVLSLQNGVDNAQRLSAVLEHPVVPAVVYVATEMAGPGHVRHHGRGELLLGPSTGSADFTAVLVQAGIPVQVSDNVAGELWGKLIVNCALNALSAVTQMPYGRLAQAPGVEQVMREVVQECQAVAQAEGLVLTTDPWAAVQRIVQTMPTQRSSTAQDLARGKRSEIDHLNGHVVRRGAALGIPTPANRVLHTLVKLLEDQPSA
jgi:2-dehydropantoate 2-reductase